MIRQILKCAVFYSVLCALAVVAQAGDSLTVEDRAWPQLSGFVDVRGVYSNQSEHANKFSVGQAEIDLEQQIAARVSCLMAIVYNSESGAFELGAAELHLTLRQDSTAFFRHAQLIAGQFDVPFGIDYCFSASPDCETVSSPWYAHRVGNWSGWNDYGVQFHAASNIGSLSLFVVNGYEESGEIVHRVFRLATGLTEDSVEAIVASPEAAFGGRLGIAPAGENVEFGVSAAAGIDDQGGTPMTLLGGDISYDGDRLGCRSEFIYSTLDLGGLRKLSRAAYLQAHCHIAACRVTSRYAAVREGAESWESQYSAGIAVPIAPQTEIRCDVIRTPEDKVVGMVQIVAAF